eukprot:GCRY01000329.1.p1 GENE.GCRY01000329.1~~GCRY01000329.1.p1  ORF type:complete len:160 (+),score=12.34 GCRY01000329.1:739-1218(+)
MQEKFPKELGYLQIFAFWSSVFSREYCSRAFFIFMVCFAIACLVFAGIFTTSLEGLQVLIFPDHGVFVPLSFFFIFRYLNGTSVSQNEPGSVITPELICGVRGVFSPNAYATRLKGVEFQELPNPENFTTFNNGFFPFWSSRPLTLAFSLLAKVKYEAM